MSYRIEAAHLLGIQHGVLSSLLMVVVVSSLTSGNTLLRRTGRDSRFKRMCVDGKTQKCEWRGRKASDYVEARGEFKLSDGSRRHEAWSTQSFLYPHAS